MNERWAASARIRNVVIGAGILGAIALGAAPAPRAQAFGTINRFGQRAEHERITRAALACAPGVASDGTCFEPKSIDQLAGTTGTLGGVGAPDVDEFFDPAQHCDDADFLNIPGYPQTREQATAQLQACITHLRGHFGEGVAAANGLLDSAGAIRGTQVFLTPSCTFVPRAPGRAKCNVLDGFGRALHGLQDFYSHSNWADEAAPGPITIDNPPGLNLPAPSNLLDMRATTTPPIPMDLSTGFFSVERSTAPPFFRVDPCPSVNGRTTHGCLNKDLALIDPVTGAATDPTTPRGMVGTNEQKAVTAAIVETRRQWADFRAALIATYGTERGNTMIRALTQDRPR